MLPYFLSLRMQRYGMSPADANKSGVGQVFSAVASITSPTFPICHAQQDCVRRICHRLALAPAHVPAFRHSLTGNKVSCGQQPPRRGGCSPCLVYNAPRRRLSRHLRADKKRSSMGDCSHCRHRCAQLQYQHTPILFHPYPQGRRTARAALCQCNRQCF